MDKTMQSVKMSYERFQHIISAEKTSSYFNGVITGITLSLLVGLLAYWVIY